MTGRTRAGGGRAGFVLIEALAVLALGALVLAGLATLVSVMLRAADRTALAMEAQETTGRAVAAVERDIRSAVRAYRIVEGRPAMTFEGASDRIGLVLERRGDDGLVRPVLVRWVSEATAAGRGRLTRTEAPLLPGMPLPDAGAGRPEVVDTGRAVIRFAYFAPQPDGEGEVLTDDWQTPQTLPAAVRVGYGDPDDPQVERSIRVPLRIGAEIACLGGRIGYCSLTGTRPSGGEREGEDETRDPRDRRPRDGGPERPR